MPIEEDINSIDKPFNDTKGALKFSNDRQVKIWQALAMLHPEFGLKVASIYEGIVIAFNGNNPEKISIVSHLARELSAILPMYVSGLPVQQARTSDSQIRKDLESVLKMLENSNKSDEKIKEIIEGLLTKIPEQQSQREQLKKVIGTHPLLGIRPAYLNDEFIKQWMRVHDYFVKNSHHHELRNQRVSLAETELSVNWNALEILIYRVLVKEPFFDTMQEVERLLKIDVPSEQDADELMRHIVESQHRRYFFDHCNNPNWLELLNKRHAFSSPQEPLKKDGYIQFLPWPESKYLVAIANVKPKEVYEIIKNLTSENQTVLYDFLKAALMSPVEISALYVDLIIKKKWLQGLYNFSLPDESADLMEKLAKEGKEKEALRLADELFNLRVDKPKLISDDPNELLFYHPDAKPYFDEWQFGEIVNKKTKELTEVRPVELLAIYAQKLNDAIELEKRENKADNFYEYSHIWRPNLLKPRNRTEDAKNILLDGIIKLIEQYKNDTVRLKEFSVVLRNHSYAFFRRVEMFLYKYKPDDFTPEAENILRKKEVIIAYNLRREYLPLLEIMYEKLSSPAKEDILKAIEEGPDFKKHEDYTDEQFERIKADWKALYLAPIKNKIPKKQTEEYLKIIKKYGESVDDDGEIVTWDGGKSPISSEELSKLSAEEILQYFADYKMPDDPFARHSSSGLGMIFAGLVTENPEKYVQILKLFFDKKIRPIYFYHLIHGLKESIRKDKCFSWDPVIELCHRVVVKNEYNSKPENNDEQDWNSVRLSIADFLGEALGKDKCDIPIILKEGIWDIISNLSEDPDPTPEYESKDSEGGLDPMTMAINTVRGEALHAVVNYGLWIARNLTDKSIQIKMPKEMEELLDKHLTQDPSLAIRSVYGWRLPNLFYLNGPWLEKNKEKIFTKNFPNYLLAAWEGYLANNIIKEIFTILKKEYYDFIPYLGTLEKKGYRAADIDQRFPQHVAVVYANEPEHEDFVDYFFEKAPVKARAEAINFTGRVILRQLEAFPDREEVKKRLGRLWDKRISLSEEQSETDELKEFGWWFKVSPFSKEETLQRTIKTLKLIKGMIDVPYEIAEDLKKYAEEFPVESISVLDLIVRAERENYQHLYKKEEYREVIKIVKATGNETANKIVKDLINYLGSIGLIDDFRDLL